MNYVITLNKSGNTFTWDEWVSKPKEERLLLNVQNEGIRVSYESAV